MYNYETMRIVMEGAEILNELVTELAGSIKALPCCADTNNLKQLAATVEVLGNATFHTMECIVSDVLENEIENTNDSEETEEETNCCECCEYRDQCLGYDGEAADEDDGGEVADELEDEFAADNVPVADLQEFLNVIGEIMEAANPISVTAEIFIKENNGNDKSEV